MGSCTVQPRDPAAKNCSHLFGHFVFLGLVVARLNLTDSAPFFYAEATDIVLEVLAVRYTGCTCVFLFLRVQDSSCQDCCVGVRLTYLLLELRDRIVIFIACTCFVHE